MPQSKSRKPTPPESSPALAAMTALNPMAATVWQDIMTESVRFMTERLQKDMETQKAMLGCTSPTELMELQTKFLQDALEDYTQEATRMLKLMSRTGTARDYDDVPL